MEIKILHLLEGAKKAEGLVVIIDVFRAFSVACYVFGNNAKKIIPVGDIKKAYELKRKNPDYILIGERNGKKQKSFDYGNSPTQIESVDFNDKIIVQTTGSGTQGIINAKKADKIITGSFVNLLAIVKYIKKYKPNKLSLVCMGISGLKIADEDKYCAEFIYNLLNGINNNFEIIVNELKNRTGKIFFDPKNKKWAPENDFYLCLNLNKFNFVLEANKEGNEKYYLKKVMI